ncbi:hypothetical protein JTE90_028732 [Oedothorax gibbosus]|uniref:Uncharacterized protein n=1 Tax=Oedothorax gibbosus TaxID=931172 RepID=A0AAV6UER5_9ARAC|nr:hypothetical protein JTE90_028732 [Oedothorax gibbosus]
MLLLKKSLEELLRVMSTRLNSMQKKSPGAGKPSKNPDHPDWKPSIFPFEKENKRSHGNKMARFRRVQDRRTAAASSRGPSSKAVVCPAAGADTVPGFDDVPEPPLGLSAYQQMCQAATMMIS